MPFCTKCKWYKNDKGINCTSFFGNPHADILFVGEAFGKSEAEEGEAFVGDAGFKFNQLLGEANLLRDDVAICNAIRCYQKGNPTPTKKELQTCFQYTYDDIQTIQPTLVVAMGNSALYTLTDETGITVWRGNIIFSEKIGLNVFCVFHPASCLYDNKKWVTLVEDFRKIPQLINSNPQKAKYVDYILVEDNNSFNKMYKSLKGNMIGFDIETTGLNPFDNEQFIRTIQLGKSEDEVYVIPKTAIESNVDGLKSLLETSPILGQTFEFDVKWVYNKLGIFPQIWFHDTCLAEYTISGMEGNDLTSLTAKYNPSMLGYDSYIYKIGGAHNITDLDLLYQYGANDISTLFPIQKRQSEIMAKENTAWFFENILMPCNKVLTKMSLRGVQFDVKRLLDVDKDFLSKSDSLLNKALLLDGVRATEDFFKQKFNPRSYQHIKHLLIEHYKLPVIKKTKKNAPSIGEKEMEIYAGEKFKNPYCKLMSEYRSIETIRSNFLSGVVPKLVDGVAHTTYSLHATTTGRPNSKNPNLLNLPNIKELERVIIPRERKVFMYGDLKQIEVRIAAVYYNDLNLIEVCNSGGDFHSMIASKIVGMDYEEFYKLYKENDQRIVEIRRKAKNVTFGILYQQGAPALAYALGISEKEAQQFINEYFNAYPDLDKNIKLHKQRVIESGYVDTYFKFRRRWYDHSAENTAMLRESVNTPIQGTAWNIMELVLIKIDKMLEEDRYNANLVMQIYDSFVVELLPKDLYDIGEKVNTIVETINEPFDGLNRVKILTDLKYGDSLCEADMEKLEI